MSTEESQTIDNVFTASANGDLEKLRKFVEQDGTSLSSPDNDGMYALHWAAQNDHSRIVQYIIEHGGDVNAGDNERSTALHHAAIKGSISAADALLQNGAQVEDADMNGMRAVHFAALYGQTSFLNHIVAKYDADFDVPKNGGERPLHIAAGNNHPEIVQYIIKHGGDVNAIGNDRWTALHYAATKGSISVADVLLQNDAQVEAADLNGKRAVHIAAQCAQTSFLNHIVDKHNADFDAPDNIGMSPLHWAAYNGYVDIVKCLLSKGASKKRQDMLGRTPLHYAALQEDLDVSMVLIEASNKEDIMVKDGEGNTAIQLVKESCIHPYMLAEALRTECKHLPNSNFKGYDVEEGTTRGDANKKWSVIIAMQGSTYTGKTSTAAALAVVLNCPVISLDSILDASEPTNEKDTLISNAFNIIAQIVYFNIMLGFSVIIDSPLSRLSHLENLVDLVSTETRYNTRLVIVECKPENEYAFQLRFEEMDPDIYASRWYKPAAVWPLPKVPRDYTDDDIPYGVSKLVIDTHDNLKVEGVVEAIFDITLCDSGHKTDYNDEWEFIHKDKKEQFTYFFSHLAPRDINPDVNPEFHFFTLDEGGDHCDILCGVCDNQVHDSHYSCGVCPLVLHKSCAEVARGEKKHFVPETFPIFLPREPHFRYTFPVERPCAKCRDDGSGFSCKCVRCLFESHLKSQLLPTVVQHKGNKYPLSLNLNAEPSDGTLCVACRKRVDYALYISDSGRYHPECALLPPLIHHHSHGGYMHDLEMITQRVEEMEDYLCDCCLKKMDPTMWYYYCGECNISMHMECAFLDFDTGGQIMEARS